MDTTDPRETPVPLDPSRKKEASEGTNRYRDIAQLDTDPHPERRPRDPPK
ncbi:MAG TPA: hypothetical protein VNZ52_11965 [Candidatus Thermoplasmatota archaeon]|nr:hypothetical protein [Candidatus Thermoplasmatota archaeon]